LICLKEHWQNQNKNLNSVASDSKLPYDELQKSETASRVGQIIAGMHPADATPKLAIESGGVITPPLRSARAT
jgi:hypothetical protein